MSSASFPDTDPVLQPVLAELLAREPIFHRPAFASTPADFAAMLVPDYWEVGASGRRYSRVFILQHLAANPPIDATAANWHLLDPQCRQLGPDAYLLTYTLHQGPRHTRRATLWQLTSTGWQALYHQGTIITADADDVPPPTSSNPCDTMNIHPSLGEA
jgi:hypothetical protein